MCAPARSPWGGREPRALRKGAGDLTAARGARGPVALHILGQVVLSPEITNQQAQLGSGAVMTLAGAGLDGEADDVADTNISGG